MRGVQGEGVNCEPQGFPCLDTQQRLGMENSKIIVTNEEPLGKTLLKVKLLVGYM